MSRSAWILHAIDLLNKHDSWCGRIHIHKLLYLTHRLLHADLPFSFQLYRFGPYSFDLDNDLRALTSFGIVEQQLRSEAYGPTHRPMANWHSISELQEIPPAEKDKLAKMAELIGDSPSGELELVATCLWGEVDQLISGDDAKLVSWVQSVKPRYSKEKVAEALNTLRSMQAALAQRE